MKRYIKLRYILFAAIIAIAAVMAVNLHSSGKGNKPEQESQPVELPPVPLNHLLTNSMCDFNGAKRFDASIERFMKYWGIRGGSFALMRNDSLLYAKGYGYANTEDSTLCEVKHIFRVASVSKLITAIAIMHMHETGQLSTGDTVFGEEGILCDSLFLNYRDKNIRKITIEHLLRHTSGFSNPHGDAAFNMELVAKFLDKPLPLTMDDMVLYATKLRLRAKPGGWYHYSNLGYIILSKVIEKVSGISYETYIRDSILAPMECYDIHLANNYTEGFRDNEVNYYEVKEAEPVSSFDGRDTIVMKSHGGNDVHGLYGAGGWIASSVELLKIVSAVNKCPVRKDFLTEESIDFMTPYGKEAKPAGWASSSSKFWLRSGSMAGTSALIKADKDGYSWVFISNSSSWNGPGLARQMNREITKALLKVKEWPETDMFSITSPIPENSL